MLEIFLITTIAFNMSVAIFVFVKNNYSEATIYHLFTSFFLSVWAASNVLAEAEHESILTNETFNAAAFASALLAIVSFVLFARAFSGEYIVRRFSRAKKLGLLLLVPVSAVLATSDLVAGSVEVSESGELLFLQGPLVVLYGLATFVLFGFGIRYLLVRTKKGNYAEKNQARFIIFGFGMALSLGIFVNIVIPASVPNYSTGTILTPLLTLVVLAPISYAMLSHRILDIRPLAARLVSLLLLFVSIGTIYVAALFVLNALFFQDEVFSVALLSVYAFLLVLLGFAIHPVHKMYSRLTGKILLHSVYETQHVVNELNSVLVANLKIAKLIEEIQKVITANLDAKFSVVRLQQNHHTYIYGKKPHPQSAELAEIDMAMIDTGMRSKQIVSLRDVALNERHRSVSNAMLAHRIAVVARVKQGASNVATIYISKKNSELPYTNKDLDVIRILASQAGLAIQNAMLYHEISAFNRTLQDRVDVATDELRQANKKLKALDKAKDEFISIASHQLRTPLTSIKGYSSLLLEDGMGKMKPEQRNAVQLMFESSERMSSVVADLLNLTRLHTGKLRLERTQVNLADIVGSEIEGFRSQLDSRDITLVVELMESMPVVEADETKLRQVIKNMLYNAMFYTLNGGTIKVLAGADSQKVVFQVVDNGIGISQSDQKHMFRKFYRAKNAQHLRPDGTGVGLYISKKIVETHGGAIIFKSRPARGSTFGFSLPLKPQKKT